MDLRILTGPQQGATYDDLLQESVGDEQAGQDLVVILQQVVRATEWSPRRSSRCAVVRGPGLRGVLPQ